MEFEEIKIRYPENGRDRSELEDILNYSFPITIKRDEKSGPLILRVDYERNNDKINRKQINIKIEKGKIESIAIKNIDYCYLNFNYPLFQFNYKRHLFIFYKLDSHKDLL